jgi:hypothetical protein
MWYLFACVASPLSITCIAPMTFDTATKCEVAAVQWQRVARASHDKASPRTQCQRIDANTPAPILTPEIRLP